MSDDYQDEVSAAPERGRRGPAALLGLLALILSAVFVVYLAGRPTTQSLLEQQERDFSVSSTRVPPLPQLQPQPQPPAQPEVNERVAELLLRMKAQQEAAELEARLKAEEEARQREAEAAKAREARVRAPMSLASAQTGFRSADGQGQTSNSSTGFDFIPEPAAVPEVSAASGETAMVLRQGKVISAVLESRVVSDLPGVIRAVVDEPVYAEDGRALLIGPGARLIGQYRSGLRTGDSRVFVVWDRLIRSDGSSVQLASPGVDELGVSGVTGDVDSRFVERFGAAAMISLIDAGVASQSNETTINLSQDGSSAAALALQDSLNIQPRITIDQGARISIMLARDVGFESVGAEPSRVAGR